MSSASEQEVRGRRVKAALRREAERVLCARWSTTAAGLSRVRPHTSVLAWLVRALATARRRSEVGPAPSDPACPISVERQRALGEEGRRDPRQVRRAPGGARLGPGVRGSTSPVLDPSRGAPARLKTRAARTS